MHGTSTGPKGREPGARERHEALREDCEVADWPPSRPGTTGLGRSGMPDPPEGVGGGGAQCERGERAQRERHEARREGDITALALEGTLVVRGVE